MRIFLPQKLEYKHARDTEEVRAGLETVITYSMSGQVCAQLLSDTRTHLRGTHREQAQPLQTIKHDAQEAL